MSTMAAFGSALARIFETTEAEDEGGRHGRSQALFLDLLDRSVRDARLGIQVGGRSFIVGQGSGDVLATVRLRDAGVFTRSLGAGNLGLGEAYMDGAVECVQGELHE